MTPVTLHDPNFLHYGPIYEQFRTKHIDVLM